jgi:hypothetical protein
MEYAVAFRDRNAALCALRPLFSFCRRIQSLRLSGE